MSRVGSKQLGLPSGVKIDVEEGCLKVQGPKGNLTTPLPPGISAAVEDGQLKFTRANEERQSRAFHGLARALAANAVTGVSQGFEKRLEIVGVGYRAAMKGKTLNMALGYSHEVDFPVPEGIEISVEDNTKLVVKGIDKQAVGQVAAKIRALRPPDPYKGKGIRLSDEVIRTKAGKSGAK
ncbi:MAG: 50S ribosomal protein L6 [Acidobacteriota bacterium]